MTHPNKAKGNRFERQLVDIATESGMEAKRAWGSNGESLGHSEEVDLVIENLRIQAKIRKKLPAYLQVPDGCDMVAFRQDRGDPLVLMTYYDFLDLVKAVRDS